MSILEVFFDDRSAAEIDRLVSMAIRPIEPSFCGACSSGPRLKAEKMSMEPPLFLIGVVVGATTGGEMEALEDMGFRFGGFMLRGASGE